MTIPAALCHRDMPVVGSGMGEYVSCLVLWGDRVGESADEPEDMIGSDRPTPSSLGALVMV
jgi:hypothetical protein